MNDIVLNDLYEKLVLVREYLENELEPDEMISKNECIDYVAYALCTIDDELVKRRWEIEQ